MKKVLTVVFLLLAGIVLAANPHFINSQTKLTIAPDGDLTVKFKESGLGDAETTYTFKAVVTVICTCVNKGGNCPQAANKVSFSSALSTTGTFSPKNGNVVATLTLSAPTCPPSDPPTCGKGQHLVLSEIMYSNIQLVDTTNNIIANLPTTMDAFYFECP